MNSKKIFVLLIGVSKYRKIGDSILELDNIPNVVHNIKGLKELFRSPSYFGVPEHNIKVLLDDQSSISKNSIERTLFYLKSNSAHADLLIVYYAGHGAVHPVSRDFYLTASYSTIDSLDIDAVNSKFFKEYAILSPKAKQKIIILDSCYSGRILESKGRLGSSYADKSIINEQVRNFLVDEENQRKIAGTFIMTSSSAKKQSRFDPNNPEIPTYFTQQLINKIIEGSKNSHEYITVNEVFESAKKYFIHWDKSNSNSNISVPIPKKFASDDASKIPFVKNIQYAKENDYWKHCYTENTILAYESYRNKYPNGKYSEEASQRISGVKEQTAFKQS